jgi:Tfp pilus assembly protein PilF
MTLLAVSLPLAIEGTVINFKKRQEIGLTVNLISAILAAAGFGLTLFRFMRTTPNILLPMNVAWTILLEMYKNFRTAAFGVGIDNYLAAFTTGRPASYNMSPIWNIRFSTGASSFLHIATVMGIIGIIAFAVLIWKMALSAKAATGWGARIAVVIAVLSLFVTPPYISTWIALSVLFIIISVSIEPLSWKIPAHISWIGSAVCFTGIILTAVSGYYLSRYIMGELFFYRSLQAAQKNDGTQTYNLQIRALTANPNIANYHIVYSQTNLALANNIAASVQTATGTGQLSENDRTLLSQLLQQAIREAKIASTLSPGNIMAWENLARIYQAIIGTVSGAEQWAVAAYQQAIQIDPINPTLRMDLGGVFLRNNNLDGAVSQLQIAIALKPDMANVYYNLAYAYSLSKQYFKQAVSLKQTLALVPDGSEDYKKVKADLDGVLPYLTKDEISALVAVKTGSATVDQMPLTPPETKSEINQIKPQIELPQSASPSAGVNEATAGAYPRELPQR